MEPVTALALVCGGIATGAVLIANFRDRVVVRSLVRRLRNPASRTDALADLHRRVAMAFASGDAFRREEAMRYALEPLIVAGLWDEVATLTTKYPGPSSADAPFWKWLAGVRALAELHRGDAEGAAEALEGVEVDQGWLGAVDALRLAVAGDGDAALARLETLKGRIGVAARYQRDLAEVHALAATGKRDRAKALLEEHRDRDDGFLEAVVQLEGPASPIARAVIAGAAGPFRAAG